MRDILGPDGPPGDGPGDGLRLLRVMFERLPAMVAYWDRDRRNIVANQAYLEWFGLPADELRGLHMRDVLGAEVYGLNLPFIDAAYAGAQQVFERTLVDSRGGTLHAEATYVPDVVDGEVVGMFVQAIDVTDRVEAQRRMDEAQRLANLGSWSWDLETDEMTWSDESYRIFGVDPREFTPRRILVLQFVHPHDIDTAMSEAAEARVARVDYQHRFRIVRPDGQVREIESHGHVTVDEEGRAVRVSGIYHDITDINASARELARINRLNSDLIGMLGHDVRSPLTVILGYLEELDENWSSLDDPLRRSMIAKVRGSAKRASRLVNDILTLAAAQSGMIRPTAREVRLEPLLTETLVDLPGGGEVSVRMEDPEVWLHVDPFHLRQIISNLVSNALRYGAQPVTILTERDGGDLVIAVEDAGPGVPAEVVDTLFERFSVSSEQTLHRGTGLGLYLVDQLARANGGSVTYHPPAVDRRATFEVRLPLD